MNQEVRLSEPSVYFIIELFDVGMRWLEVGSFLLLDGCLCVFGVLLCLLHFFLHDLQSGLESEHCHHALGELDIVGAGIFESQE